MVKNFIGLYFRIVFIYILLNIKKPISQSFNIKVNTKLCKYWKCLALLS